MEQSRAVLSPAIGGNQIEGRESIRQLEILRPLDSAGRGLARLSQITQFAEQVSQAAKEYDRALTNALLSLTALKARNKFVACLCNLNQDIKDLGALLRQDGSIFAKEFLAGISSERRDKTYSQMIEVITITAYEIARVSNNHGTRRSVKGIREKLLEILRDMRDSLWILVHELERYFDSLVLPEEPHAKSEYAITRIKRCREAWVEVTQRTSAAKRELSKAPVAGSGPP